MHRSFFFILLLFFGDHSFGQPYLTIVDNLELPSNHIYKIEQDGQGNLWFASNHGIVKFDGYTSTHFTVKNGLPFNDVFSLVITPQNPDKVWYFASGKYCGYIHNDSVFRISNPEGKIINPGIIHRMDDQIFIESMNDLYWPGPNHFYRVLSEKKRYQLIEHLIGTTGTFPDFFKHSIFFQEGKVGFIRITATTLYQYFPDQGKFVTFNVNLNGVQPDKKVSAFQISDEIYAAIYTNGIALINLVTHHAKFYPFEKKLTEAEAKYVSCQMSESGIQINHAGRLILLDHQFKVIENNQIPPTNGTHNYFRDFNGNIWVPEFSNGVKMLSYVNRQTETFLRETKVNKLTLFNGEVIADAPDIGYFRLAPNDDQFFFDKNMPNKQLAYGNRKITRDKTLLISSGNSYELTTHGSIPFEIMFNGVKCSEFKDICYNGQFGYAISGGNLLFFNRNTLQTTNYIKAPGTIRLELFKEKIYLAGTYGLQLLSGDSLIAVSSSNDLFQIPVNETVQHRDFLIVGTDGRGIYLWNEKQLFHLQCTDGLIVRKIIPDENRLWLATDQGVVQITVNENNPTLSKQTDAFYQGDGLILDNVNDICIQDNNLFASCDQGISKINVKNPCYRRPITLNFNSVNDTIYKKPGEESPVAVHIGIINYVNQNYFKLFFKLDENQWEQTEQRKLEFHNLAPGTHKLTVKVEDQHLNTTIKTTSIHVFPLWWQTGWAKVLFVFCGLLLALGLAKIVQSGIRKTMHTRIENSKKLYQLELQALRAQMNPHFIHNSLNSVLYYIQRNEADLSEHYLEKISTLIRLFFEYAHLQQITFREEIVLLQTYLEIEHMRFEDKLSYEIILDERLAIDELTVPSMILQPLVENAINHGIFHKQEKGKVTIEFLASKSSDFAVIITDDGVGQSKTENHKFNYRTDHRYNSSVVLKERLKLFEQSGLWKISYKIEDRLDLEQQTGTRVYLKISKNENQNIIS